MATLSVAKTDGSILFSMQQEMVFSNSLPLILAITAAKRFKDMNQVPALAIRFALVYPNIAASFTAEKPLYTLCWFSVESRFFDFLRCFQYRQHQYLFHRAVVNGPSSDCSCLGWSQD